MTTAQTYAGDVLEITMENIERLRDGDRTPAVANAVVNNVSAMLRLSKLQMDYAKMTGDKPNIPLLRSRRR